MLFYFFYRINTLNIYLYALHCYYTLRNSNKKMVLMKLYKNKKNPNRGNSLWKLSMTNLLGYLGYFNILLVYLKGKT
ncbi:hypothetical protein CN442_08710 [Bacillus thuringiensis]|nr:hypothetical protein CN442_08710 [Bacillus thuringiensis]